LHTEDGYIISKCLEGDSAAFGILVDKYKASIYALAYSKLGNFSDAEDVAQEVFIKAYRNLRTLRRWDSFHVWLYSITTNLCKMRIRTKAKQPDRESIEDQDLKALEHPFIYSYREELVFQSLREALDSLPDIHRQVLILHYLGGMSIREVAGVLGKSTRTIDRWLKTARSQLKEEMLEMMNNTFEQQRLQAVFTLRIFETIKHIRLNPLSSTKILPWGLSLATGFLAMFLSFSPYSIHVLHKALPGSSLPGKPQIQKIGEMPFDALNAIKVTFASGQQAGNGNSGGSKRSNSQSTFALAPKGQEYKFVKSWPSEALGLRYATDVAVDDSGNIYVADAGNYCIQKFDPNGNLLAKWGTQGSGNGQLSFFEGLTVDRLGNVYVADSYNNRIQKFDKNGKFLMKWGIFGQGDGELSGPSGIVLDDLGNIYVADKYNHRIQKFDPKGKFLTKWGSEGFGNGQFEYPIGIAIDRSGNVNVADYSNNRIQKFDPEGNFLTKWGIQGSGDGQFNGTIDIGVDSSGNIYVVDGQDRIQKFDSQGKFLTKWGNMGSGDGQFGWAGGMALDKFGNVYISEKINSRVQKFDPDGKFLAKFGNDGFNDGQFSWPWGVATDSSGKVYVADTLSHRIQVFDSQGNFLTKWGALGSGEGQFYRPSDVAIDKSGNVYVADSYNNRIQKFDVDGKFLIKWGIEGDRDGELNTPGCIAFDDSGNIYVVDIWNFRIQKFDPEGRFLLKWGSSGTEDGQFQFWGGGGIAIANSKNIYVADSGNNRIQVFDPNGKFLTKWGTEGSGDGQFKGPNRIAINSAENVFVTDSGNNRIQVFDLKGNFLTKWGSEGTEKGQFKGPSGIAVNGSGYVYISEMGNNRIQKFEPSDLAVDPLNKLHGTWGGIKQTELYQNYPNPFNPETWIPYQLGKDTESEIKIYTSNGQLVRKLDLGQKQAGSYINQENAAYWDGRNDAGECVSSGVYYYSIQAGEYSATKKMIVVR
jgi:RNA polymerase sigma factor (sigma-70 family)